MAADFFEFQASLKKPRPSAAPRPGASGEPAALTVGELTAKLTKVIQSGLPGVVLVRGELSNFKANPSSGHFYFTLKDAQACIDCVMFRGQAQRLKFTPADGMEILAEGRVGIYPPRGRYQLQVEALRPLGQGALELAFQQTRKKLAAQGLFDAARKRPLPPYPLRVAIVTSPQAAALGDILKVLKRFPWLKLKLYPTPVQGDGAAAKVAAALAAANAAQGAHGGADVILLVRGGGSLEDLWSFNEEEVARAVAASRIPIVSGIGHEVDVSIADLAADYHAHTPTEAAQVITSRWRGAGDVLDSGEIRLGRAARAALGERRQRLVAIERHEVFRRPGDRVRMLAQLMDDRQRALGAAEDQLLRRRRDRLLDAAVRHDRFMPTVLLRLGDLLSGRGRRLDQAMAARLRAANERTARADARLQQNHPRSRVRAAVQRLDEGRPRLERAMTRHLLGRLGQLEAIFRQLEAVSPQSVLRRGYTITTRKKDGAVLRGAVQIKAGEKLITQFADGQVESVVQDARQLSLFD